MSADYLVVKTVSGFAVVQHVAGPGPYLGECAVVDIESSSKADALGHAQRLARQHGKPGPEEQDAKERERAGAPSAQLGEMRRQAQEAPTP